MDDETRPVRQPRAEAHPQPATLPYAAAPAPRPRRGRLLLSALVAVVALVAGTAGLAIGHVTANDGRDGPVRVFERGPGPGAGGPGPFGRPDDDVRPPGGLPEGQPPTT